MLAAGGPAHDAELLQMPKRDRHRWNGEVEPLAGGGDGDQRLGQEKTEMRKAGS